jgi:hypothetical protein
VLKSTRTVARKRHQVPSWVISVLWPVLHYDEWRRAWILKGIGERFGPVLQRSQPHRTPIGSPSLILLAAGAMIVAAAGLGLVAGRDLTGGSAPAGLDRHVAGGPVRLAYAANWRPVPSSLPARLGLVDPIVLAPSGTRGELLIVGHSVTTAPQFLPRALLTSLPSTPRPEPVSLGGSRFYRYPRLVPKGDSGSESAYAMPTTIGTVLGLCVVPAADRRFTDRCERALSTLRLTSGQALPVGPSTAYASQLNSVTERLNVARTSAGRQLRTVPSGRAQAQAADVLARAYRRAVTGLSSVAAGPAAAANRAVVAALARAAAGYQSLGRAASALDAPGYSAAQRSLREAARALQIAYSRLNAFGYVVG